MHESLSDAGEHRFLAIDKLRLLSESYACDDRKVRRMLQEGVTSEAWFHCTVLNQFFLENDINPESGSSSELSLLDRSVLIELAQPCAQHYEISAETLVDDWLLCMSHM